MSKAKWRKLTGYGAQSVKTVQTSTYQVELHEITGKPNSGHISHVETDGDFVVITVTKVLKHKTTEE